MPVSQGHARVLRDVHVSAAVHEAAHAIVASALGCTVYLCELEEDGIGGTCRYFDVPALQESSAAAFHQRNLVISLAGTLAEFRYNDIEIRFEHHFGEILYLYRRIADIGIDWVRDELDCVGTTDPDGLSQALRLFETHPSSEEEAAALLRDSIQQTLRLLDSHWLAVLEKACEVHSLWLWRET